MSPDERHPEEQGLKHHVPRVNIVSELPDERHPEEQGLKPRI